MPTYRPVTAAMRVLQVLQAVNRHEGAELNNIFAATRLSRPTIIRMLQTLEHTGFVFRERGGQKYFPTARTLELSRGYNKSSELVAVATPHLTNLQRRIGWPSELAVYDVDAMVVVATTDKLGPLYFGRPIGFRSPILATSIGLSYLAHCSGEEKDQTFLAIKGSRAPWDKAARTRKQFDAILESVRARGFATIDQTFTQKEYSGAVATLGVPILLNKIAVASINLKYLIDTIDSVDAERRLLGPLKETAKNIASELHGFVAG